MADINVTQPDDKKKKKKGIGVNFKVSQKGAVSVYGLGRFPVTLYREQWLRLLERTDDLRKFMEEHAGELKEKGDTTGAATPGVREGEPIEGAAGTDSSRSEPERGLGPQGSAVGAPATDVAVNPEDAGAPRLDSVPPEGGTPAAAVNRSPGGMEMPAGRSEGSQGTGSEAAEGRSPRGDAGSAPVGAQGRALGNAEVGVPARDEEGKLAPGNENIAQEPDLGYHDDYPVTERPTDPWRPGRAPGVDGVREGDIDGVREDREFDRDEDI